MPAPFVQWPLPFLAPFCLSLPKPFHSEFRAAELPLWVRHLTCSVRRFQMPQWLAAALGKPDPGALSSSLLHECPYPLLTDAGPGMDRTLPQARVRFFLGHKSWENCSLLKNVTSIYMSCMSRIEAALLVVILIKQDPNAPRGPGMEELYLAFSKNAKQQDRIPL